MSASLLLGAAMALAPAGNAFADTVLNGSMLLALPVALLAGLVSFVSPCVLPLVPGYLGYVSGLTGVDLEQQKRGRMVAGIGLFVVGLYLALAAYGLFEPPEDQLWAELAVSPGAVLGRLAVVAPIVVVLAGPVAWYLSCATWPLAALSFVYAGRALRPSYRGDRLSFTSHVAPGTTIGPPVPGPVAPATVFDEVTNG